MRRRIEKKKYIFFLQEFQPAEKGNYEEGAKRNGGRSKSLIILPAQRRELKKIRDADKTEICAER